jgi:uncharacterized RDD family membrane protein YckC
VPPSPPAPPPAQGYQPPPGYEPPPGYQPAPGYQPPPGYPPPGYQYLPPPTSPGGYPLADFGQRLLARIIDGAILGGVASVILVPLYIYLVIYLLQPSVTMDGRIVDPGVDFWWPLLGFVAFVLVFSLVLAYVYEVEMMFRTGQTFGKRIIKIRIIPVDPAQTLTRRHAARRFLVQQGAQLVPGLSWVDGLFQLWDKPYRQCLHDKFATTLVIKLGA